jgi:hypothetical protein
MNSFRFRPTVDGLEDRTVPNVTPTQVIQAYTYANATADEIHGVIDTLSNARTTQEIQYIGNHFRLVTDGNRAASQILAVYMKELQTQIASDPTQAGSLSQLLGGVGAAEFQAVVNSAYADVIATGFGVPPPVPPPPPVENSAPDFGAPSTSTLPFSLTDPNFQTQPSGVRTWDVTTGTGTALQTGDQFTAKYTGYLPDGTIFDSSDKSGNLSTTLDSSHLIPGFAAGLVGMQPGGTRRIDIPANLAYGANPPAGSGIPANSELIFEVTLISSP